MFIQEKVSTDSGVYCIQNLINSHIYIGSAKNLRRRYYAHRAPGAMFYNMPALCSAYKKYKSDDFSFTVIKITEDYKLWENLFVNLLDPEYNTAGMIEGELQPNLGKKFSQEWIDKLGKCQGHSEETKATLTKLNKEGATKVKFEKNNEVLFFNSWREAGVHFNRKNPIGIFTKTKKGDFYFWKGWKITKLSSQKKKVKVTTKTNEEIMFESSYACDKYFNLWRGAVSNAIKNNKGILFQCKVEYV